MLTQFIDESLIDLFDRWLTRKYSIKLLQDEFKRVKETSLSLIYRSTYRLHDQNINYLHLELTFNAQKLIAQISTSRFNLLRISFNGNCTKFELMLFVHSVLLTRTRICTIWLSTIDSLKNYRHSTHKYMLVSSIWKNHYIILKMILLRNTVMDVMKGVKVFHPKHKIIMKYLSHYTTIVFFPVR